MYSTGLRFLLTLSVAMPVFGLPAVIEEILAPSIAAGTSYRIEGAKTPTVGNVAETEAKVSFVYPYQAKVTLGN